ncbi:G-D-S-L family lipolytic protein [Aquimarina sp. 2201CG5-10]|uniref:G-D-S-L family lipolytic protein n=1 Tax=Aquimarina callyspongiae TaxID=3098150 RepID=UPI002AB57A09|nr:G-D-S-L family lipolytic protein [Aquimarina sp. 2201CG5-10]MDY8135268.1 G-D-S-L family lipolytic protein [Aquimarina sp. 2201CG5-10]
MILRNINIQYKWLLILLAFGFIACESDDDATTPIPEVITPGSADFSKFVSLGNSLTAGFTDGALFIAGQENSMPNILAQQFALAGGGSFTQPLMNDNIGGALLGGTQILSSRLFFNGSGPAVLPANPTTEITNTISGPFNNMGIPGAKSFHLLAPGYGNVAGVATGQANPYFARMASSSTATVLEDAMAQSPTFFSLWIGNNDVLGYATSGGDGTDPITDLTLFTQSYNGLVATLTSGGAKGVVANIPNVTSIPHFTTVPHNPVPLDAATAAAVNGAYAAYNGGIVQAFAGLVMAGAISQEDADAEIARRTISFTAGEGNAVVILDEDLTDLTGLNPALVNMRQATADDLLVLPASSFIGTLADPQNPLSVNGVAIPLADNWVLTPEEQQEIATATEAFNNVISSAVQQAGLAFIDANSSLAELAQNGIQFDEFLLQGNLVFGGAFSLDGVHPTARGYAFVSNLAIDAINTTYGSNLPKVKAANYPTFYSATLQ